MLDSTPAWLYRLLTDAVCSAMQAGTIELVKKLGHLHLPLDEIVKLGSLPLQAGTVELRAEVAKLKTELTAAQGECEERLQVGGTCRVQGGRRRGEGGCRGGAV